MKKILLLIFLCSSCVHVVPLKKPYETQAQNLVINNPVQDVRQRFALLAIYHGYPINNIDQNTGLITIGQTVFEHGTFERKDGQLANPKAYIVAEKFSNEYPNRTDKYTFTARWNQLITPASGNRTQIRIKLYDIAAFSDDITLNGKSTGNFESWLVDQLTEKKQSYTY